MVGVVKRTLLIYNRRSFDVKICNTVSVCSKNATNIDIIDSSSNHVYVCLCICVCTCVHVYMFIRIHVYNVCLIILNN